MPDIHILQANDGKDGVYKYKGSSDVNNVYRDNGAWMGGNVENLDEVVGKSIEQMNKWKKNTYGNVKNLMFIATHPSWGNKWYCWQGSSEQDNNKKFMHEKAKEPSIKASYPQVHIYTLHHPSHNEFVATPLQTNITSNEFNATLTNNINEDFKNGKYVFSASSTEKDFGPISVKPYYPFSEKNSIQVWMSDGTASSPAFSQFNIGIKDVSGGTSSSLTYSQSPYDKDGKYQGGGGCGNKWTTVSNYGESTNGEWLQIHLPYHLHLKRFNLVSNAKTYWILRSNDGKSWERLERKELTSTLLDNNIEYLIHIRNSYSYFRIVFTEIFTNFNPKIEGLPKYDNMYGIGVVDCKLIGKLGAVHRDHFTNMETFTGSVYEGLDNIYSQESKLLTDLKDFNQKYLDYTSCSSSSCSTLSAKTKAMNDAYDLIINTDIPNLNKNMPSTGLSPAQYDASYSHLVSTHNNVLRLRNELDVKMKELNMEPNTKYGDYKANFDSAIYTNILVTVLATTILYFAFVKL